MLLGNAKGAEPSATAPSEDLTFQQTIAERVTRFELATFSLGRDHSVSGSVEQASQAVVNDGVSDSDQSLASADLGNVRQPFAASLLLSKPANPVEPGDRVPLLTVKQVAAMLGVSTASVYKLCDRGELRHTRVLNAVRVSRAEVMRFAMR